MKCRQGKLAKGIRVPAPAPHWDQRADLTQSDMVPLTSDFVLSIRQKNYTAGVLRTTLFQEARALGDHWTVTMETSTPQAGMGRTVMWRAKKTDMQNLEPYPLCTCEGTSHLIPGATPPKHGGIEAPGVGNRFQLWGPGKAGVLRTSTGGK